MIEITLAEGDRVEWALKAFKKKVLREGLLRELRRRRPLREAERGAAAQERGGPTPSPARASRTLTQRHHGVPPRRARRRRAPGRA
jgi:ribosomal protein S21